MSDFDIMDVDTQQWMKQAKPTNLEQACQYWAENWLYRMLL